MLGLMLLTAINYQSSLIYLLTFILGAIFVVSIWLCFFNMQGLSVRVLDIQPVQANMPVTISLAANTNGKERSGFYVMPEGGDTPVLWPIERKDRCELDGRSYARGVYAIPAIRLETFFPFGLVRAWTWLWFEPEIVVYPEPLEPPSDASSASSNEGDSNQRDGEELGELKSFQTGDSLRRVLWRHFARRDELIVRAPEKVGSQQATLDWESYSSHGVELALSYMCFDVLSLYEANVEFEFTMPGKHIPMGSGEAHRNSCLEVLARYGA